MRYLPLTEADRRDMLAKIGVASIDDLFADVPQAAKRSHIAGLPSHQSEMQVEKYLSAMAAENIAAGDVPFFCGAGAYRHHIPAMVDHIIQRSEFLTSYTPYQPEISQGTLQYLFEFQSQVVALTGMDVANASMYDGSTAAAEAVLMAHRLTGKSRAILSSRLHPHYRDVIANLSAMGGFAMAQPELDLSMPEDLSALVDEETSCVVIQNPDFFGNVADFSELAAQMQAKGILVIAVVTEIVSLGLLKRPGDMGADIVVGEGQSLGNGLNFGGPYVGLFAARKAYLRQMPGRLCGETTDADGKRGYVLTLSTREQHIRRDKATSNICTNSGLCALAFTIHLTLLGGHGLRHLAELNHARAVELADMLASLNGVEILTPHFFNEFAIRVPGKGCDFVDRLAEENVLAGVPAARLLPDCGVDDVILLAATEMTDREDMAACRQALQAVLS